MDTICIDKTGTLTTASLRLVESACAGTSRGADDALGRLRPSERNLTLARSRALPAPRARRRGSFLSGGAGAVRDRRHPLRARRARALPLGGLEPAPRNEEPDAASWRSGSRRRLSRRIPMPAPGARPRPRVLAEELRGRRARRSRSSSSRASVVVLSGDAARTVAHRSDAGFRCRRPLAGASPHDDAELDRLRARSRSSAASLPRKRRSSSHYVGAAAMWP